MGPARLAVGPSCCPDTPRHVTSSSWPQWAARLLPWLLAACMTLAVSPRPCPPGPALPVSIRGSRSLAATPTRPRATREGQEGPPRAVEHHLSYVSKFLHDTGQVV